MEKNNQVASSFTNDLFGTRDSSPNSAANGIFSSIFSPPSAVSANYSTSKFNGNKYELPDGSQSFCTGVQGAMIKGKKDEGNFISSKEMKSILQESPGPSPLSSSLYYGAQEDMYVNSSSPHTSGPDTDHKKDGAINDTSANNSTDACRGNWWQGSLYY